MAVGDGEGVGDGGGTVDGGGVVISGFGSNSLNWLRSMKFDMTSYYL